MTILDAAHDTVSCPCCVAAATEIERLNSLLSNPEEFRAEIDSRKGVFVEFKHHAVALFVASLADTLGEAPNFTTLDVFDPEQQQTYSVIVQRKWHKTPAQRIGELEKMLAKATAAGFLPGQNE